eukprot:CAMPEP_0119354792 /NCGR_PEP_ID=MMETSP1334-20130426/3773_1 /TAXON_ID=127549 /ORGANISM="Calcidiscus leptoporus, Strain RCC1130" /LENGTH=394 /DNA_ID=CAMNT_0007368463 /DNA_START=118 /DNA_END=1302 /DNA_ORIENTATION=+
MSGIYVTLLDDPLWVGSVAPDDLPAATWPVLKAMLDAPGDKTGFFSITQEEDGLTLVMDARCQAAFTETSHSVPVSYAPQKWLAFEIHLGALAWEVPGVVCFLSTMMAESAISILNLSTYDRDFLLVSEPDVQKASGVIRESLQTDVDGLKEAMLELDVRRSASGHPEQLDAPLSRETAPLCSWEDGVAEQSGAAGDGFRGGGALAGGGAWGVTGSVEGAVLSHCNGLSCKLPLLRASQPGCAERGELYIKVLAAKLVVVQLQLSMLQQSTNALVKRLFFDTNAARRSFWSYTHTDCDVSLIIDETSLRDFPEGAILGPPTRWRAVKLCGHQFAFDETGVVSAMFAPYKERLPLLNVSTFSTNVTLVEEKDLDRALGAFEVARIIVESEEHSDV